MRDIELLPIPSVIPDPAVDDAAYAEPSPGGIASDTAMVDPSFTDTKAYGRPSLGGDFGIGRAAILGADADGGAADLDAATTIVVTPPVVPTPPIVWPGRAANATTFLNLYPWHKTPPEGLDSNNPNPPPAMSDPTGVTVTGNVLSGNQGNAAFSGTAARNATVTLNYSIDGGPIQQVVIMILVGDTGPQIASKVRAAIDAVFGLDAGGTGGSLLVVGLGGLLTYFNISVS